MKHIIDINGLELQITDLEGAIHQARTFSGFEMSPPGNQEENRRLTIYWTDIWIKLEMVKHGEEPENDNTEILFPEQLRPVVLQCLSENWKVETHKNEEVCIWREQADLVARIIKGTGEHWILKWMPADK
ncbi:hypothetical protein ACQKLP_10810 [Chitinophaga sp. NPDC101104]|uniref:hypothetical protein n=1 Tax=Chitinophaga sp. NPDC101104 TaxID=3390561 RepID=UPI003CFCF29D